MAGLFGNTNRRTQDLFSNMSAGQRFGQAAGNARNAQDARGVQAAEMQRQAAMDDLTKQYRQSQIAQANRVAPVETFSDVFGGDGGYAGQRSNLSNQFTPYNRPNQPNAPTQYNVEYDEQGRPFRKTSNYGDVQNIPIVPTAEETRISREEESATKLKAKRTEAMPDARFQMDTSFADTDSIVTLIDRMLNNDVGRERSVGGMWDSNFPNTLASKETKDFRADAQNLTSALTLDKLVNLKKAGGTLGAVNAKEFETLQTAIANLQTIQDQDRYKEELKRVRAKMTDMMGRIQSAYKAKYGKIEGYSGGDANIGSRSISDYVAPSDQKAVAGPPNDPFNIRKLR
jgi:hypothetical protein